MLFRFLILCLLLTIPQKSFPVPEKDTAEKASSVQVSTSYGFQYSFEVIVNSSGKEEIISKKVEIAWPFGSTPPIYRANENVFLFKVRKHLILGTHHSLPIGIFPPNVRKLLSSCKRYFGESFPSYHPLHLKPGAFVKATCQKLVQDLVKKFPYEGIAWSHRIDQKALLFPTVQVAFEGLDLDTIHPSVFLHFLKHHEQFDKELIKSLKELKEEKEEIEYGMDSVIEAYFLNKNPNKVFGCETALDQLLSATFIKRERERLKNLISIFLKRDPINYGKSRPIVMVKDINAYIIKYMEKYTQRARTSSFFEETTPTFEAFYPFVRTCEEVEEDDVSIECDTEKAGLFFKPKTSREKCPPVNEKELHELCTAYTNGDIDSLLKEFSDDTPEEAEEMAFRNQNMVSVIQHELPSKEETLFSVGVAHLFGVDSILETLEKEGHPLEVYRPQVGKFIPIKYAEITTVFKRAL